MTIQWHINENCNLRCKHCYQDNYQDEGFSIDELIFVLNKIEEFVIDRNQNVKSKYKAHINFTGGEPFLKKEFLQLLKEVIKRNIFSFGILSNGFLLNNQKLAELKELNPKFIQISLDGNKQINDAIRGEGSFDSIIHSLQTYKKLKIPILISFTANSSNYKSFPDVVAVARKYGVYKVWTDRYIPVSETDNLIMNTIQFKEFLEIISKEQKKSKYYFFTKTKVSSNRALQFLISGGQPYKCSAGDKLLAILANGDVMPCRRLPVIIGNIMNEKLQDIYNNQISKSINCTDYINKECNNCYYAKSCNGGLKCLSFAKYGDFNRKDSNCWI